MDAMYGEETLIARMDAHMDNVLEDAPLKLVLNLEKHVVDGIMDAVNQSIVEVVLQHKLVVMDNV